MQSDIHVDKDYDKTSHRAIQHLETHVFLKFAVKFEVMYLYRSHKSYIIWV